MGILDWLFGRSAAPAQGRAPQTSSGRPGHVGREPSADERAIARYRYLLRTAAPEQIEAVHAEAFAQLTPPQRQQLLGELSQTLPAGEGVASAEPADLARAVTRAEMRQPGYLQSTLSRGSFGGPSLGQTVMGSMFGTMAGLMVGSALAHVVFSGYDSSPEAAEVGESDAAAADNGSDGGDAGGEGDDAGGGSADSGVDSGGDWGDSGGGWGDSGGGWGDSGGFGGGDFGGGDFGGGFDGGF